MSVDRPFVPWTDEEYDRLADKLISTSKRLIEAKQDAEAKRAAAKEKRERKAAQKKLIET